MPSNNAPKWSAMVKSHKRQQQQRMNNNNNVAKYGLFSLQFAVLMATQGEKNVKPQKCSAATQNELTLPIYITICKYL